LQAFRHLFGRVTFIGALAVTGFVSAPATAHAAAGTTSLELPVIELKAKSEAQPTTTTTAPKTGLTIMTIPTANVGNNTPSGETSQQATTTTQAATTGTSGSSDAGVAGDSNGSSGSNESNSGGSLASTGVNARQITGIAMLLTAIGIALLTFTNSVNRTERFVRSLLPHRISGK
jgi:hypothetical protein